MASSTPARFGQGQHASDDRHLFLKMFGGEVLAAYAEAVITKGKHRTKGISQGKSFQFPKTWKATSEYHTAGTELLGNDIDTSEIIVTVDGLLVSHVGIYDLDEKIAHFDVTNQFSKELGAELARAYDRNVLRQIVLAARTAADGPFPGGNVIVDAALENSGAISGVDWIEAIRAANIALFNKDVPESAPRYFACNAEVFDAIKYAKDAAGHYLVVNRDFGEQKIANRVESLQIDGVTILRSRLLPTTNLSADTSVWSKYRADYSGTKAILWVPDAVATVELLGVAMETERDVRRQEDFMVAKMAVGHGTLRPEGAVEFRKAALV